MKDIVDLIIISIFALLSLLIVMDRIKGIVAIKMKKNDKTV